MTGEIKLGLHVVTGHGRIDVEKDFDNIEDLIEYAKTAIQWIRDFIDKESVQL